MTLNDGRVASVYRNHCQRWNGLLFVLVTLTE